MKKWTSQKWQWSSEKAAALALHRLRRKKKDASSGEGKSQKNIKVSKNEQLSKPAFDAGAQQAIEEAEKLAKEKKKKKKRKKGKGVYLPKAKIERLKSLKKVRSA